MSVNQCLYMSFPAGFYVWSADTSTFKPACGKLAGSLLGFVSRYFALPFWRAFRNLAPKSSVCSVWFAFATSWPDTLMIITAFPGLRGFANAHINTFTIGQFLAPDCICRISFFGPSFLATSSDDSDENRRSQVPRAVNSVLITFASIVSNLLACLLTLVLGLSSSLHTLRSRFVCFLNVFPQWTQRLLSSSRSLPARSTRKARLR